MHINSHYKNNVQDATEYARLLHAIKYIRTKLRDEAGVDFNHYSRVYTEPRTYGITTKYFWCRTGFPQAAIERWIASNPTVVVDNTTYELSGKSTGFASYRLHLNKPKTNRKTA